jgi:hypothetical protein
MTVIAHAAHWAFWIAMWMPAIAFMVWLGAMALRDRHRGGDGRYPWLGDEDG